MWFNLAAAQGNSSASKYAPKYRDSVAAKMTDLCRRIQGAETGPRMGSKAPEEIMPSRSKNSLQKGTT